MRDHLPISPYCHYHNHPEYDRRSLPLTNGLIHSYGKVVLDLQCLISHSQIPCPCMHGQRAAVERSDVDVFPRHLFKKVRAVWNPISLKDITMNLKNFSLSLVSSGVNSNNVCEQHFKRHTKLTSATLLWMVSLLLHSHWNKCTFTYWKESRECSFWTQTESAQEINKGFGQKLLPECLKQQYEAVSCQGLKSDCECNLQSFKNSKLRRPINTRSPQWRNTSPEIWIRKKQMFRNC